MARRNFSISSNSGRESSKEIDTDNEDEDAKELKKLQKKMQVLKERVESRKRARDPEEEEEGSSKKKKQKKPPVPVSPIPIVDRPSYYRKPPGREALRGLRKLIGITEKTQKIWNAANKQIRNILIKGLDDIDHVTWDEQSDTKRGACVKKIAELYPWLANTQRHWLIASICRLRCNNQRESCAKNESGKNKKKGGKKRPRKDDDGDNSDNDNNGDNGDNGDDDSNGNTDADDDNGRETKKRRVEGKLKATSPKQKKAPVASTSRASIVDDKTESFEAQEESPPKPETIEELALRIAGSPCPDPNCSHKIVQKPTLELAQLFRDYEGMKVDSPEFAMAIEKICDQIGLETQHEKLALEAQKNGWPLSIDFDKLRNDTLALKKVLDDGLVDNSARRHSIVWIALSSLLNDESIPLHRVEAVLKNDPKALDGILRKLRVGYFGETGAAVIENTLDTMYDDEELSSVRAPLSGKIFKLCFLVPTVGVQLIAADRGIDDHQAFDIMKKSSNMGYKLHRLRDDERIIQAIRDHNEKERSKPKTEAPSQLLRKKSFDKTASHRPSPAPVTPVLSRRPSLDSKPPLSRQPSVTAVPDQQSRAPLETANTNSPAKSPAPKAMAKKTTARPKKPSAPARKNPTRAKKA